MLSRLLTSDKVLRYFDSRYNIEMVTKTVFNLDIKQSFTIYKIVSIDQCAPLKIILRNKTCKLIEIYFGY